MVQWSRGPRDEYALVGARDIRDERSARGAVEQQFVGGRGQRVTAVVTPLKLLAKSPWLQL